MRFLRDEEGGDARASGFNRRGGSQSGAGMEDGAAGQVEPARIGMGEANPVWAIRLLIPVGISSPQIWLRLKCG
jgi:hypothetical protein